MPWGHFGIKGCPRSKRMQRPGEKWRVFGSRASVGVVLGVMLGVVFLGSWCGEVPCGVSGFR